MRIDLLERRLRSLHLGLERLHGVEGLLGAPGLLLRLGRDLGDLGLERLVLRLERRIESQSLRRSSARERFLPRRRCGSFGRLMHGRLHLRTHRRELLLVLVLLRA